jgi:hypothetical protein
MVRTVEEALSEAHIESAALRGLVREMGKILNRFVNEYYGITAESLQVDARQTKEILNRPEVKEIVGKSSTSE